MKLSNSVCGIGLLVVAFATGSARAGFELQINGLVDDGKNGHENSKIVTINFKNSSNHWVSERVYADPLRATYRGQPFIVYCVDIYHNINLNSHYDVLLKDTSDPALAHHDIVTELMTGYANVADTAAKRAALQIAIWEAVVDGDSGTGGLTDSHHGSFYVTNVDSSVLNLANSYLQGFNAAGSLNPVTWFDAGNSGGQSMVSLDRVVPEPASIVLGAVGAFTLGGAALRELRTRRQQSKSSDAM